jgi:hypothetical protein
MARTSDWGLARFGLAVPGFEGELAERDHALQRVRVALQDHRVAGLQHRIGQRDDPPVVGQQDRSHLRLAIAEPLQVPRWTCPPSASLP